MPIAPWVAAAAALVWGIGEARRPAATSGGVARFRIALPPEEARLPSYVPNLAISPDGRSFVYASGKGAAGRLWLRRLDQLHATPIAGTEGASSPAFSPDGRSLVFATLARGEVRIVSLAGGLPTVVAAGATWGNAWGADGFLYYATAHDVRRMPAAGGASEVLVRTDSTRGEVLTYLPEPLPSGRGILFVSVSRSEDEIRALRLATHEIVRLGPGALARYVSGGYLAVVHRDGTLTVAPFDQDKVAVTGAAVPILGHVGVLAFKNGAELSVSGSGNLVYSEAGAGAETTPVWVDRSGNAREVEPGWHGVFDDPALSPDGSRIALSITGAAGADIWIKQVGGAASRLTLDGNGYVRPGWSPDGRSVLYTLEAGGLMLQPADGSAPARPPVRSPRQILEGQISRDGAWLVYRLGGGSGDSRDIYARRLSGADSTPVPLVASPADEFSPALSPDGKWLAYASDESGRSEVYVRPFPDASRAKWQVSNGGGAEPVWAHSGRELFYRSLADSIVAVGVRPGGDFAMGDRKQLFDSSPYHDEGERVHADYAVSADDQRLLMLRDRAGAEPPLVLVLNWIEELRQRVGVRR